MKIGHDIMTSGQVARACRVSARTVRKWLDTGLLPGYTIPGTHERRVHRHEVIRLMNEYGLPMDLMREAYACVILVAGAPPPVADRLRERYSEEDGCLVIQARSLFELGIRVSQARHDAIVIDLAIGRIDAALAVRMLRESPRGAGYEGYRSGGHKVVIVGLVGTRDLEDHAYIEKLIETGFTKVVDYTGDVAGAIEESLRRKS